MYCIRYNGMAIKWVYDVNRKFNLAGNKKKKTDMNYGLRDIAFPLLSYRQGLQKYKTARVPSIKSLSWTAAIIAYFAQAITLLFGRCTVRNFAGTSTIQRQRPSIFWDVTRCILPHNVGKKKKSVFLNCLTLEDAADRLSRNVSNQLQPMPRNNLALSVVRYFVWCV
jgi:hypothetical protein